MKIKIKRRMIHNGSMCSIEHAAEERDYSVNVWKRIDAEIGHSKNQV